MHPERGARVLGVAAHRAVIEHEPFGGEHLREADERQPEPVLRRPGCARRGWVRAARGERAPWASATVTIVVVPSSLVSLYFARAVTTRTGPPRRYAESAALLEADPLDHSFERRVQDLHPLLGHRRGGEVAAAFALGLVCAPEARRPSPTCWPRIRRGLELQLGGEPNHLLHLVGELDLQLRDVDPLGLRHEDAAAKQLELLFDLLVGPPQLVALGGHPRELLRRRRELGPERGDVLAHLGVGLRRRLELRHGSTGSPVGAGFSSPERSASARSIAPCARAPVSARACAIDAGPTTRRRRCRRAAPRASRHRPRRAAPPARLSPAL